MLKACENFVVIGEICEISCTLGEQERMTDLPFYIPDKVCMESWRLEKEEN